MQYLLKTIKPVPMTCVWEITNRCNLRCVHCESSSGSPAHDELTTPEALDLCRDLFKLGCKRVNLSGGEPLLRKDWRYLTAKLKGYGIEVNLITNGLLFNKVTAQHCRELSVDWVSISIDGLMETHDSIRLYPRKTACNTSPFRKAFEALALSRSMGLHTCVITHINGRNINELEGLHSLLSLIPIDGWQVQLGTPQGRMLQTEKGYLIDPSQLPFIADFISEHQDKPFRIIPTDDIGYYTDREPKLRPSDSEHFPFWLGCYAGILGIAIESNGGIKGCPSLPHSYVEGNIRERSLSDIWNDPDSFPYNRKWDVRKLRGFCRRCEFKHLCRAGCTSFAIASTGTYYENRHCLYRLEALNRK